MLVYPSLLPSPPLLCPSPWFPHRPLCLWPPPLSLLHSRCPASASLSSLLRPWSTAPRPPSPRKSVPRRLSTPPLPSQRSSPSPRLPPPPRSTPPHPHPLSRPPR